jgi:uncharacterized small protein (DUF1192 family)
MDRRQQQVFQIMFERLKRFTAITAMCIASTAPATAQTEAQSELALRGLDGQIAALEARGDANLFELGALQTLRAVEKTLQTRYEYGLGDSALNMPLLRLPVGGRGNPLAKPAGPETLSMMIETFLTDMEAVRATLDRAEAAGVAPFTLALGDIWFDTNLNARRDAGEGAVELLGPLLLGRRAMRDMGKEETRFEVRFDEADHAWLKAYTHMLSGFGNAYMAFDPTPVFTRLAEGRENLKQAPRLPDYYDLAEVTAEIATLKAEQERIKAEREALRAASKPANDEIRALRQEMRKPENQDRREEFNDKIKELRDGMKDATEQQRALSLARRSVRNELRSAEAKLPGGGAEMNRQTENFRPTVDAIYVLVAALKQQPDAARVQNAMTHWRAMIAENRRFWALIEAETDNDREWIPNANQQPALPVEIDPEMTRAWQGVLEDAEAVLNGRLLIPHPMLPAGHGISLAHYERYPSPIDLIEAIHGIGFFEHSAKGPMITSQRWQAFNRLARGRGGLFSVYFN